MQLSEFSSQGFRNLTCEPVSFGAGITLVAGENAQGKTNLLEAICLLCGQRSFRGAAPADMASDGARFSISGVVERAGVSERLAVSWSAQAGREFFRAEKPAGFREVSALAPAVFLAPEHRELVTGAPAVRRRFLDRLVLGLKPAGADDLARYAAALKERNALLLRFRHGRGSASPGELDAWTEELAAAGALVRRHRSAALSLWRREFESLASAAGSEYAAIGVAYPAETESAERLREAFERLLPLERRRGHSLAGPHRDDLSWTRRGRPLAAQASAGEVTRTAALAKLAEWTALAKVSGDLPLFGADDFDAGLSGGSAALLIDALPRDAAVVLTTSADPSRWARRASAVLEIRGGAAAARRLLRAVEVSGLAASGLEAGAGTSR